MLSSKKLELVQERRKLPLAVMLVFLMLASTMLAIVEGISQQESPAPETALVAGGSPTRNLLTDHCAVVTYLTPCRASSPRATAPTRGIDAAHPHPRQQPKRQQRLRVALARLLQRRKT